MKTSLKFLALSKPNISTGLHRLIKGFKNFSQLFGQSKFIFQLSFFFFYIKERFKLEIFLEEVNTIASSAITH
jgi:hypothetical protein